MANALTAARVLLIFAIIAVWQRGAGFHAGWIDVAMVPLLAWAIFMDALDGWAARRFGEESKAGALFDIAGDRIVELALWTFFAIRRDATGQPFVPFWVPLAIITRTVLTDVVRSAAAAEGRTPFGASTLQTSLWARQLTASRWSRATYGVLKAVCFCALGLMLALPALHLPVALGARAQAATRFLVYATTVVAVVRGIPVLWDGRHLIWKIRGPRAERGAATADQ